ncbi:choice-of-anchor Q domain-containing protein [Gimesia aquarii]|uniref:Probable pectate lyase C n=1 Tax=Gimesia aquarii TaxID=2527964 RepID=A0A517X325_9PLAN|nr:choice-of-anchor Q domain-containing protein [Gimesia aquarii]QDU11903.1 putative outer membrane protein PmpC precursor [Gimesia aquarii]
MFRFRWLSSLKDKLRIPHSRNRRNCRKQNRRVQAPFAQASVSKFVTESLEDRTLLTAFTVVNTNDSGTGSLREAIELANANAGADTITFDASLSGQSIVLTNELIITDDLTITGLGADQLTLDGNKNSRIFDIDDGNTNTSILVEFSSLNLTNGFSDYGGAVRNSETLSIVDSTITKNEGQFFGGGIYTKEGDLSVFNSTITENQSSHGGGIYSNNGTLIVKNSNVSNNDVTTYGGGIYYQNEFEIANSSSSISDSIFSENKAVSGGGIYISPGSLTVSQSNFSLNEASDGAGIFSRGGILTVDGSTFSENTASDPRYFGSGGGIYSTFYGSLRVSDSLFSGNTATRFGGGIFNTISDVHLVSNSTFIQNSARNGGGIYNTIATMTVIDGTFIENEATADGGGIHHATNSHHPEIYEVVISQSHFSKNHAKSHGGGINIVSGIMSISESTFIENSAMNSGGGVYNNLAALTVEDSTFNKNTATRTAGGIGNRGTLSILRSTLTENTTGISGGAVFNNSTGRVTITNTTLSGNNSSNVGGGLYSYSSGNLSLTVINSTIVLNSATNQGGGIYSHFVTPAITNSLIAGNIADSTPEVYGSHIGNSNIIQDSIDGLIDPILRDNGGPTKTHALLAGSDAINAGDNNAGINAGLITDQRSSLFERFSENAIDIGAFEFQALSLVVDTTSDLENNDFSPGQLSLREALRLANLNPNLDTITFDATLTGQTITLTEELLISDDLTIIGLGADQLTIDGNQNSRIFYVDDNNWNATINVEINGLTLTNGYAANGGAIHNKEILTISNSMISENEAINNGGGIHHIKGTLTVTNTTFTKNLSIDGGGIYNNLGTVTVTNSTFLENTATTTQGQGGGIFSSNGSLDVIDSTFLRNSAPVWGGGIFTRLSPLMVMRSTFSENSGSNGGGAIYHSQKSMIVKQSSFSNNLATKPATNSDGGAIANYFSQEETVEITNCSFLGNSAGYRGGAVANLGGNMLISDCSFSENTANYGGGIYAGETVTVRNSTISINRATFGGGAVFSEAGMILIINSTLSGNNVTGTTDRNGYGGGIYYQGTLPVFVINSTITGNSASHFGGGIYSRQNSVTLTNSILAGNIAPDDSQINGSFTNNSSIVQNSIIGLIDPVLRDNGGLTQTHALLIDSPAIDAGDNAVANDSKLTTDQRGTGFDRIIGGTVDLGAYEVQIFHTQIDLRIVNSKTPTHNNGERSTLPENLSWIDEWSGYWLEIWISTPSTIDLGILSAAFNLSYNTAITTATRIEYGSAFTLNQTGTINDVTGTIENLSAETSQTDVSDDQCVLFARIRFESTDDDNIDLDLAGQSLNQQTPEFAIHSPEILFTGDVVSEEIHGSSPNTKIYANPYDLNDDDAINFKDLMLFASVYNTIPSESSSDYSWFADLNQSDRVNFKDLVLFASNYGKRKLDHPTIVYPQNFPHAWNNQLLVDTTQGEPQLAPETLSQSTADTALNNVVEHVSPQLNPSQNETLEQIDIQVVDLEGNTLGRAVSGTIYIDANAAGYGWFVDATPGDNSEFQVESQLSLIALPETDAAGHVDLWSVIMHELGHLLGFEHENEGLMQDTLPPGVRRLPSWELNIDLEDNSLPEEADSFFLTIQDETELVPF